MGNVYRFLEPVLLYMLREKGQAHGYELARSLQDYALTDAEIEGAALYRTLRRLEQHDFVRSKWDEGRGGPARRIYLLTKNGEQHLAEWAQVLDHLSKSMTKFVKKARKEPAGASPRPAPRSATRHQPQRPGQSLRHLERQRPPNNK